MSNNVANGSGGSFERARFIDPGNDEVVLDVIAAVM